MAVNFAKLPALLRQKTRPAPTIRNLGGRRSRSTNLPSSLPQLLSATVAGGASGLSVVVTCGAVASSGFSATGWVVDWSVALATTTGVALDA